MRIGSFHSVSVLVKTTPFYKTLSHCDQSEIYDSVVVAGLLCGCLWFDHDTAGGKPNSQMLTINRPEWSEVEDPENKGRQDRAKLTQSLPTTEHHHHYWRVKVLSADHTELCRSNGFTGFRLTTVEYRGYQPKMSIINDLFPKVIKYISGWLVRYNG